MFMRGQHVGHIAALGDDFQNITVIDDSHKPILLFGRETCACANRSCKECGDPCGTAARRFGNYFLVTSCSTSTCGRPSSKAPIAPPKAFM
jgi:hypothetical protein